MPGVGCRSGTGGDVRGAGASMRGVGAVMARKALSALQCWSIGDRVRIINLEHTAPTVEFVRGAEYEGGATPGFGVGDGFCSLSGRAEAIVVAGCQMRRTRRAATGVGSLLLGWVWERRGRGQSDRPMVSAAGVGSGDVDIDEPMCPAPFCRYRRRRWLPGWSPTWQSCLLRMERPLRF